MKTAAVKPDQAPRKRKHKARRKRVPVKTKIPKREFTPKQELFIREYLVDMNATRAYLRAGYKVSEKVARTNGPRMLDNAGISTAINNALGRRLSKLDINNDTVLQEIAKMAFGNMLDYIKVQADGTAYVDLSKLTREQAAAIQELSFEELMEGCGEDARPIKKVKFKLADKKGSLELLGKYLKLFSDTTPVMSQGMEALLNGVISGTMPAREAAYRITLLGLPLPEVLKIELSKAQPEPPAPEIPPSMDDAELEERYNEQMRKRDQQVKEWVPERQGEVKALKEELKGADSFAPGIEDGRRADG